MSEPKTKPTNASVEQFLSTIEPTQKRTDAFTLLELFTRATGEKAVMWGPSIVGFGMYHFKSEKSRQEGDWPLSGFSPRKQNLTLYVLGGNKESTDLFKKLGKHTTSKSCLYINKLADIDLSVLELLVGRSYEHAKKTLT